MISSPLYLFITILFFLPLFQVSCSGPDGKKYGVMFHGLSLSAGVPPYMKGLDPSEKKKIREELQSPYHAAIDEDSYVELTKSYDWLFLLVPVISLSLTIRVWKASARPIRSGSFYYEFAVIVTGLLLYYTMVGFIIEHHLHDSVQDYIQDPMDIPMDIGKTSWFWLMLAFSIAGMFMLALRKNSIYLCIGDKGLEIRSSFSSHETPASQAAADKPAISHDQTTH